MKCFAFLSTYTALSTPVQLAERKGELLLGISSDEGGDLRGAFITAIRLRKPCSDSQICQANTKPH